MKGMNKIGAHKLILLYGGVNAIKKVEILIKVTDIIKATRRPFLSAIQPKTTPPKGLIINPIANTPKVASKNINWLLAGKNN